MNLQTVLREARKLDIRTRELVEGLLQGAHLSRFRGRGIEFSDVREYQWGDDVRTIDWNITARTGTPYVKEFVEERDLDICLMMDMSASTDFGDTMAKRERAHILAGTFLLCALNKNDSIGAVLFTDHVERFIPPKKGRKHGMALLDNIIHFQPAHKSTDLTIALTQAQSLLKPRTLVILISDFPDVRLEGALRKLRHQQIPLALHLIDHREFDLPDVGYLRLEDEETQEQILIDTSDPQLREKFRKLALGKIEELRRTFHRCDIPYLLVDENIHQSLRQYFGGRA